MNARLTLGAKLKDLRVAKKLKLADVETVIGISTSTLQRLESEQAEAISEMKETVETVPDAQKGLTSQKPSSCAKNWG